MGMNVELTPQLVKHIRMKVKSGGYRSASEYVREALRLKLREEKESQLNWLRSEVSKGFESVEAGRYTDYDKAGLKELAASVKARGKTRAAAEQGATKPKRKA
jgi:putative addiction module CopG family antidote